MTNIKGNRIAPTRGAWGDIDDKFREQLEATLPIMETEKALLETEPADLKSAGPNWKSRNLQLF
jgi:hypothetical protein